MVGQRRYEDEGGELKAGKEKQKKKKEEEEIENGRVEIYAYAYACIYRRCTYNIYTTVL